MTRLRAMRPNVPEKLLKIVTGNILPSAVYFLSLLLDYSNQLNRLDVMKAKEIGAFHAKTHLSELLEKVREGQSFCITKRGHPVAELRPVASVERRARFGCDKGRLTIGADFDAPVPDLKDYTR